MELFIYLAHYRVVYIVNVIVRDAKMNPTDEYVKLKREGLNLASAGNEDEAKIKYTKAIQKAREAMHGDISSYWRTVIGIDINELEGLAGTKSTGLEHIVQRAERPASRLGRHSKFRLPIQPKTQMSDVKGLYDVKKQIENLIDDQIHNSGIARGLGMNTSGGILLYGPPGNGKTMIAEAIANYIPDAEYFVASGADIESSFVGGTERNIKKLFKEARKAKRAVIFIDEIDKFLKQRGRGNFGSDYTDKVVASFLEELDGIASDTEGQLIVIGATNIPWALDPAATRYGRFDRKVYVGLPDEEAAVAILQKNLTKRNDAQVDRKYLLGFDPRAPIYRLNSEGKPEVDAEGKNVLDYSNPIVEIGKKLYEEGFSGADIAGLVDIAMTDTMDDIKKEWAKISGNRNVDESKLENTLGINYEGIRMTKNRLYKLIDDKKRVDRSGTEAGEPYHEWHRNIAQQGKSEANKRDYGDGVYGRGQGAMVDEIAAKVIEKMGLGAQDFGSEYITPSGLTVTSRMPGTQTQQQILRD